MDKEFKLEIRRIKKDNDKVKYFVCLSYIGDDEHLRLEIERIKQETFFYEDMENQKQAYKTNDLCIFTLMLGVNELDKIDGTFYFGDADNFDLLRYETNSNCHLYSFYNNALTYDLENFDSIKRLKGIGRMLLCVIIHDILDKKILSRDNFITLEASGEIGGKGMEGLVRYYEKLGFRQIFPDLFKVGIAQSNVPMKATLGEIIDNCDFSDMSEDVNKLYKTISIKNF